MCSSMLSVLSRRTAASPPTGFGSSNQRATKSFSANPAESLAAA